MDSISSPIFDASSESNRRTANACGLVETAGDSTASNNAQGNLGVARALQQTQEVAAQRHQTHEDALRAEQRIKELIQRQQQPTSSTTNAPNYGVSAAPIHAVPGTGVGSLSHNNPLQAQIENPIAAQIQHQSLALQRHTHLTGNAATSAILTEIQPALATQNQTQERSIEQPNAVNCPTAKHSAPTDTQMSQPKQAYPAPAGNVNGNTNANKASPGKSPIIDLGENIANCPQPVAKPEDPPDSFVVVELPNGVAAGDRIQISIPILLDKVNASEGKGAAPTDEEKDKERKIAFIVPHTYTATPEGNGFVIVNTSISKRPRLIMPDPSNIPSASELGASHKTSPRKTPLHIPNTEKGQPTPPVAKEKQESRVGANFQVAYLPPCKGSDAFQSQITNLASDKQKLNTFLAQYELRSEDLCVATYNPKQEPANLPDVLKPSRPNAHLINWSEDDRTLFHRLMVRSMKSYPAVVKVVGKKMVEVLAYYYGAYKHTKEYKVFKAKCPKHTDEFILCRVCNKQKADVTCDLCTDACHLKCVEPPLTQVPGGEVWHCHFCKDDEKKKRKATIGRNYRETSPQKKSSVLESLPIVPPIPLLTAASLQVSSQTQNNSLKTSNGTATVAGSKVTEPRSLKRKATQLPPVLTVLGTKEAPKTTGPQNAAKATPSVSGTSEKTAANVRTNQLPSGDKASQDSKPVSKPKNNPKSAPKSDSKAKASQEKQIKGKDQKPKSTPSKSKSKVEAPSDSDSSDDNDEDAAKLGQPEYITRKSELAFFNDVRFNFPAPAINHKDGERGIPWKIKVGDILAFHIQDANPPLYFKDSDYINAPKAEMAKIWHPFEVPWSPGEVISITWVPDGVNITTFRKNMTEKVDPNKKNYYSVKVDLDDVLIEVRWLYRCTEIKQALQTRRPKKGATTPTKATKEKFCSPSKTEIEMGTFMDLENRPVDEVWETDHVDEVDLATALGPIRLLSSNDFLNVPNANIKSPVDHTFKMTPAQLVCRKFYFVQRMKEAEFPKWVGSSRLERGLNLSPKIKKAPAYKTARSKKVIAMASDKKTITI